MKKMLGLILCLSLVVGCALPGSQSPVDVMVAVGGGGGIARSLDHGATWERVMSFKTQEFKSNIQVDGDALIKGELNRGRFAQIDAIASAVGQIESQGFLGNLNVRGTLYQQLGQTWVGPIANPFGATDIRGISLGNVVFVAGGLNGKLARSTDFGATWGALLGNPFTVGPLSILAVSYGNNVFLIAGGNGESARSTDFGVTWSAYIPTPLTTVDSLAYGNGVFVGTGVNGANGGITRSLDLGVTWLGPIANPFGTPILGVAYGNGVFVAIGGNGGIVRSTDNGATWSSASNPFGVSGIIAVAYGNGVFVAVGTGGKIARSVDYGLSWGSLISNPFAAFNIYAVSYNFGIFQATGDNGQTARSYDNGVTWGSLVTNPFGTNIIYGIASSTTNMAAVGAAGSIATAGWNAVFSSAPEQLYVPVFTNFGIVTNVVISWRMIANHVHIDGSLNAGIMVNAEARMSLPNGMTGDSLLIGAIAAGNAQNCGTFGRTAAFAGSAHCLIEPGKAYITFGIQSAGLGGMAKVIGTNLCGNGELVSIHCDLAVTGANV